MSFLSDFEEQLTTAFTTVVNPVSASIATGFQPAFLVGFTIWLYLIAYDVAWGKTEDGMTYIFTKVGKIFLIGTLALYGWGMLHEFMDGLRATFVARVSCPGGGCPGTISSALEVQLLDPLGQIGANIYSAILNEFTLANAISSALQMSFMAKAILIFGTLFAYVILMFCVVTLSIICLAMYMVSFATFNLLMALGPFFLMCLAFPVTQKFFETWTGAVMTATLAMALTTLLAVLSSSAIGLQSVVAGTRNIDFEGGYSFMTTILSKGAFALLLVYLYYKVFDLAASLGGGMNIGNNMAGAVRTIARDLMGKSGGGRSGSATNSIGNGSSAGSGASSAPSRSGFRDALAANQSMTGMAATATGRALGPVASAGGRALAAGGRGAMAGGAMAGRGAIAGAQAAALAGVAAGRFAYNRGLAAKRLLLN